MQPFIIAEETFIPADLDTVWTFFSNPHNLEKISPGQLKFTVIECPDVDAIYEDMRIEYRVSPVLRIPLKWVTLIKSVKPMQSFIDTQITGPFSLWEHTHTFEERNGGVLMKDVVRYKIPFGPLGLVARRLFVKRQLQTIFEYRRAVVKRTFG